MKKEDMTPDELRAKARSIASAIGVDVHDFAKAIGTHDLLELMSLYSRMAMQPGTDANSKFVYFFATQGIIAIITDMLDRGEI